MKSQTFSLKVNTPDYDSLKTFLEFLKANKLSIHQKEVQDVFSYNNIFQDYENLDLSDSKDLELIELIVYLAKPSTSVEYEDFNKVKFDFDNLELFNPRSGNLGGLPPCWIAI